MSQGPHEPQPFTFDLKYTGDDDLPLEDVYILEWFIGIFRAARIGYAAWGARSAATAATAQGPVGSFRHGLRFFHYMKGRYGNIPITAMVRIEGTHLHLSSVSVNYGGSAALTDGLVNTLSHSALRRVLLREIPNIARKQGFTKMTMEWQRVGASMGGSTAKAGRLGAKTINL